MLLGLNEVLRLYDEYFLLITKMLWHLLYLLFGLFGGLIGAGQSALVRIKRGTAGQLFGNDQIYNTIVTVRAF